ncbi:hypothetical protein ILUMI_11414 [Ignelater luminosus]|uniref:Uncharacterized protein n=1 Tax=Ignelater luminosus TaxID=2038154 RepID=A0A8K0CW08_IGNLU|nr:hypothetical protein ILUMI_11414 [Ignelater luminosus]
MLTINILRRASGILQRNRTSRFKTILGQQTMAEEKKCYPDYDENLWLRSCKQEIVKPIEGKITGTIPRWINGELIRNGPGTLTIENSTFQHIFDSLALLRKFTVKNGEVTYQCRFLESEVYKACTEAKRIVMTGFGTKSVPDPCHSIFQRVSSMFVKDNRIFDNSSVSIYPFHDELYAFGEVSVIHKINKETLETEKRVNVNNKEFTIIHHTAHPHVTEDGTVYNLAITKKKRQLEHNIVCFPAKTAEDSNDRSMFDKASIVASIPVRWPFYPAYMHSFGITENYFIIVEQPFTLSVPQLMVNRLINEPPVNSFKSFNSEMTQFSIVNRKTGKVNRVYSKSFFYFHIINQYELLNHIVLDVCSYDEALGIEYFNVENMKNLQSDPYAAKALKCHCTRFVLPLAEFSENLNMTDNTNLVNIPNSEAEAHFLPDGKIFVKPELLCNIGCELPRINYEKYLGKEYQYFYAMGMDIDAEKPGMLVKVDVKNKTEKIWYEKNCYASEPIFVPSPESEEEDDGVVLAGLIWGGSDTNRVGLIVLDAKTMTELGKAEFHTPSSMPRCFHGWFVPEKNSKL